MTQDPSADPKAAADRIERSIFIAAPRERVWRALSNAEEFGSWFGANMKGQVFAAGQRARGNITYPGYEHLWFDVQVQEVRPQELISWRWHPYPIDPAVDYAQEEPTRVTFTLEDAPGGTLLRVVESGFERVPAHRRPEAFRMNSQGWDGQMQNIVKHVA